MPTQEEIDLLKQVFKAQGVDNLPPSSGTGSAADLAIEALKMEQNGGVSSTAQNPAQQALDALRKMQQNGQAPTSDKANSSINQAMDAIKAFQGGGAPTTGLPSSSGNDGQKIQSAMDALKKLQQNNSQQQTQSPQNSSNDSGLASDITMELKKFHKMMESQGLQLQAQAGFDYTGALSNDGQVSTAESLVMFAQFAGKLEDEGHLSSRIARRPVSEEKKQYAITVMENYLGDKADALDVLSEKELNATIKFMAMPESSRMQIMGKAMQDSDMQKVRELPKSDKISAVFHVPASGDQEAMTIDLNNPTKTETQAYVEVDANIYTPPTDDAPGIG